MHESPLAHILRRSRLKALASAAGHALHLDSRANAATEVTSESDAVVDKRFYASLNEYSPQQLSSIQAAESSSAAAAASKSVRRISYRWVMIARLTPEDSECLYVGSSTSRINNSKTSCPGR